MTLLLALLGLLPSSPPELGAVDWGRDYGAARRQAQSSGRPILILFDEVPGCSTCVRYGESVLSHPLLVDAIEEAFVPLAIYNNAGGADREVLERFGEPAWNNPVVRIVDAHGRALAPRLAGDYRVSSLVERMQEALQKAQRQPPPYLDEAAIGTTRVTAFGMSCFWAGEACIGGLPGVRATRTGFAAGKEVVELRFDPTVTSRQALYRAIEAQGCSQHVFVLDSSEREDAEEVFERVTVYDGIRPSPKDDKHALQRTLVRYLPLTEVQATRINSAVAAGEDFTPMLSPSQRRLWQAIQRRPQAEWPVPNSDDFAASMAAALAARPEEASGRGPARSPL